LPSGGSRRKYLSSPAHLIHRVGSSTRNKPYRNCSRRPGARVPQKETAEEIRTQEILEKPGAGERIRTIDLNITSASSGTLPETGESRESQNRDKTETSETGRTPRTLNVASVPQGCPRRKGADRSVADCKDCFEEGGRGGRFSPTGGHPDAHSAMPIGLTSLTNASRSNWLCRSNA
jgi:hypothetical protein